MTTAMRWMAIVLAVILAGCAKPPKPQAAKAAVHEHPTKGPHGGPLAEWGAEEYHAEFTHDAKTGEATVYILDGEAMKAKAIASESVTLTLKAQPSVTVTLTARPQEGDANGSSRFVGRHDALAHDKKFTGTITGVVAGTPYAGDFDAARAHKMPAGVGGTPAEKTLFLTPGGIYTAADIQANGNVVPSEKFKGISWPHDDDLKPGDKLCPVTDNKADARCNWIVAGKKYEFCCTPCLDKFVKWAKEKPEKIKAPEAYIHR